MTNQIYNDASQYLAGPQTEVVELLLREVPAHVDQMMRPFQTQSNSALVDAVLGHDPSLPFNAAGIASAASSFLAISAVPEGTAYMTNGWRTSRFIFKLTTRTHSVLGTHTEVLTGYTDYLGANFATQSIDPNMRFYVNQTTLLDFTSNAMRVLGNNMVLSNTHSYEVNPQSPYSPETRLNNMLPINIAAEINIRQWQTAPMTFGDRVLNSAKLAPMAHNTQAGFVSEMVAGMQNSFASPDYANGNDIRSSYATSIHNYIKPSTLTDSGFMTMLKHLYGKETSEFTMSDLRTFDNFVDHKTHLKFMLEGAQRDYGNDKAGTQGSDLATVFATTINNAIAGLMLSNNLTAVVIRASNYTLDGQPAIEFSNPQSYAAYDLSGALGRLKTRLTLEVLNPLSHNNLIKYNIVINALAFGDTTIDIQVGDNTFMTPFAFPTFACAAYSPMLTANESNIDNVVNGFSNLFDHMFNKFGEGVGAVPMTENDFLTAQQGSLGFGTQAPPAPDFNPFQQPMTPVQMTPVQPQSAPIGVDFNFF